MDIRRDPCGYRLPHGGEAARARHLGDPRLHHMHARGPHRVAARVVSGRRKMARTAPSPVTGAMDSSGRSSTTRCALEELVRGRAPTVRPCALSPGALHDRGADSCDDAVDPGGVPARAAADDHHVVVHRSSSLRGNGNRISALRAQPVGNSAQSPCHHLGPSTCHGCGPAHRPVRVGRFGERRVLRFG